MLLFWFDAFWLLVAAAAPFVAVTAPGAVGSYVVVVAAAVVHMSSLVCSCCMCRLPPPLHLLGRVRGHGHRRPLHGAPLLVFVGQDAPLGPGEEELGRLVAQPRRLLRHPHVAEDAAKNSLQ